MVKYEFWTQLRKLERKYDQKVHSPVRRRLQKLDDWATVLMEDWSPMERVPRWLSNELKHVEEGRRTGSVAAGRSHDAPPKFADLMFHGVLSGKPWGGSVLPPDFTLPSQRLTQRAPLDEGWAKDCVS